MREKSRGEGRKCKEEKGGIGVEMGGEWRRGEKRRLRIERGEEHRREESRGDGRRRGRGDGRRTEERGGG